MARNRHCMLATFTFGRRRIQFFKPLVMLRRPVTINTRLVATLLRAGTSPSVAYSLNLGIAIAFIASRLLGTNVYRADFTFTS